MNRLLRGEAAKLFATRLPLWSLVTAALCGGGLTGLLSLIGPENATPPLPGLDTAEGVGIVVGMSGLLLFVPALIGTIAVTGDTGIARSARPSWRCRVAAGCSRRSSSSSEPSASRTEWSPPSSPVSPS